MVLNTTVSAFKLAFQQVGNALTPTAPPRRDFTEARLQLARNRAKGRRALVNPPCPLANLTLDQNILT